MAQAGQTPALPETADRSLFAAGAGARFGPLALTPPYQAVGAGDAAALQVQFYTVDGSRQTVDPSLLTFEMEATAGALLGQDGRFIATRPGRYRIHARFRGGGPAIHPAEVAVYGAPERLRILGPATVVANGAPAALQLVVADAQGTVVPTAGGVAAVTWAGGSAAVDVSAGRGQFTISPDTGGSVLELKASMESAGAALTGSRTIVVEEPRPTGLHLTRGDRYLLANTSEGTAAVAAAVVDQAGVPLRDGRSYQLQVQVSGPAGLADGGQAGTVTYVAAPGGEAVVTLQARKGESGPVRVNLRLPGAGEATADMRAAIAGAARNLEFVLPDLPLVAPGQAVPVTVRTVDAAGIPAEAEGPVQVAFSPSVAAWAAGGRTRPKPSAAWS